MEPSREEILDAEQPVGLQRGARVSSLVPRIGSLLLAGLILIALFGPADCFSRNGSAVSKAYFLAITLPGLVVLSLLYGTITFGLRRHRPWSRWLAAASWIAQSLYLVLIAAATPEYLSAGDLLPELVILIVAFTISLWYFFRKSNVVAYYDLLKA